jgi:hypothetical protein
MAPTMGMKEPTLRTMETRGCDHRKRWVAWVRGQDCVEVETHGSGDFPDDFIFIPLSDNSAREYRRAKFLQPIFKAHEDLTSRIRGGFSF